MVLDERRDIHHAIHVLRRPSRTRGRIGDEQLADHSADENDLVDDLAEAACHRVELLWSFHALSLRSISWIASFRSRALPARTASTSASHSYSRASRNAARGADL